MLSNRIQGRVWLFGDHIDSDLVVPISYNTEPVEKAADHVFENFMPDFRKEFEHGDIVVAGHNFGCGSGQTLAVEVMKSLGVGAVLANSFARIFFRNAVANGLPILELEQVSLFVNQGDLIQLDLERAKLHNLTTSQSMKGIPLFKDILETIENGGLIPRLKLQREYQN